MRFPAVLVLFLVTLVPLVGCGDNVAEVSGTVKYNGELVKHGSIRFDPVDKSAPSQGASIVNGQYSAKVAVGEMKVSFTGAKEVGTKKRYPELPNSEDIPIMAPLKLEKYSTEQTPERLMVGRGTNKKDWDLTGPE